MKHIIFKRNEDGSLGEKLGSYEGPKDDTSTNRSYLHAEPMACHLELLEGLDEDCIEAADVDGFWIAVENEDLVLAKRQGIAQANLDAIRALRQPMLDEADIEIFKLEDDAGDETVMRAWRKALRECTDDLKKVNGEAKLSCENLVPEEFEFPAKPE